jgi:hypothetical protein
MAPRERLQLRHNKDEFELSAPWLHPPPQRMNIHESPMPPRKTVLTPRRVRGILMLRDKHSHLVAVSIIEIRMA